MGTRAGPASPHRRRLLRGLSAGGAAAALQPVLASAATCTREAALVAPARGGFLGRLRPAGDALVLHAGAAGRLPSGVAHGPLGYQVRQSGQAFLNPTLVLRRGDHLRAQVVNALDTPTT